MIDFSCKHDILILNPDGSVQPMDEPYFAAVPVQPARRGSGSCRAADAPGEPGAPGGGGKADVCTWQILSDGDYSYLAAGRECAISIDTGYGCGNIRAFEQTLTDAPVRFAANTHDHFDHTAGNSYFDAVYMSAATEPLATRPYPSFAGIEFPGAREVRIVRDGDVIDLGERQLEVLSMPDHAAGSLLFLDRRERILFAGDEISDFKRINGTVSAVYEQLLRLLALRDSFDLICAGPGLFPADTVERLAACAKKILDETETLQGSAAGDGFPGVPAEAGAWHAPEVPGCEGRTIYERRGARPEDLPPDFDRPDPFKRVFAQGGVRIQYDVRRVR